MDLKCNQSLINKKLAMALNLPMSRDPNQIIQVIYFIQKALKTLANKKTIKMKILSAMLITSNKLFHFNNNNNNNNTLYYKINRKRLTKVYKFNSISAKKIMFKLKLLN
jgi:hypothetical protein